MSNYDTKDSDLVSGEDSIFPVTCPECGSKNVCSRSLHRQHICRDCDCVFVDDDYAPQEVLQHGKEFGKKCKTRFDD